MVEKHKLTFIGPSADSMRKMGDKATARRTMIENNVPVKELKNLISRKKEKMENQNVVQSVCLRIYVIQ